MAVAPRPPGDYAPAAGSRAVEAVHEAARDAARRADPPRDGGRIRGADARPARRAALDRGRRRRRAWSGGSCSAMPRCRRVAGALHGGLRGGESAIADSDWRAYTAACARVAQELDGAHDLVVLHDPGALGLAPRARGARGSHGSCHTNAATPEEDALTRVTALVAACDLVLVPDSVFLPAGIPARRDRAGAARDRPARPAQPRAGATAAGPGGAAAGRGPRPALLPPVARARPLGRPAFRDRVLPARTRGGALAPAGACGEARRGRERGVACGRRRCPTTPADTPGVILITSYESLGSLELGALQHLARVVLERSFGEGWTSSPCEALWKRTPVVGGTGGGLPSRFATAWTGSSRTTTKPRPRTS